MGAGYFTQQRWAVACSGWHLQRRPGWPAVLWCGLYALTGHLMHRDRRA
jgi:hypothetical protein